MSKIYITIFTDEDEKWHYFENEFDENQFPNGFADYYITVVDGIIEEDTYSPLNKGKSFESIYDTKLWNK